jgi:MFS family permease
MVFLLTQYLQLVLGFSSLQAGLRVLPIPIVFMASAPLSAFLVERWGQRRVVTVGLVVLATGMALLSRSGLHSHYFFLGLGLSAAALGMGLTNAPSTGAIMTSVPLNKAGVASAINDATRELGGALGVAVLGSIVVSRFHVDFGPALRQLPVAARATSTNLGEALTTAGSRHDELGEVVATAARQAYVDAIRFTLVVAATIALLAAGLVSYLLRPRLTVDQRVMAASQAA